MSVKIDEHMGTTLAMVQRNFVPKVKIRFRVQNYLENSTREVDSISVNGFTDPSSFFEEVAMNCDSLYLQLLVHTLSKDGDLPDLIKMIYTYLPPLDSLFIFRPIAAKGGRPPSLNKRCIFGNINWQIEYGDGTGDWRSLERETGDWDRYQTEDLNLDKCDNQLLKASEEKILQTLWPYSQIVFDSTGYLYERLHVLYMGVFAGTPKVSGYKKSHCCGFQLPTIPEVTDCATKDILHTIGIPFLSKN